MQNCHKYLRLLTLGLLLATAVVLAYGGDIRGLVRDADGEALPGASVRVLAVKDSTLVSGVVTDADGNFTLRDVAPGKYIINIDYVGYAPVYDNVTVGNGPLNLKPTVLASKSHNLREVQVTAVKTPITVKEDTIEFNADTYKVQPNAVVEDLLKRLPGVEVGTDGSITANGKTVSKILVDGKEFFGDDPTVASKNLPATMVDKLQVVDRKSDLARLTGVDDGEEETVINLTVKKGMQNGWFGNVQAGYGTDDRYMASFNVNHFWNGNQLTLLGNANNINNMGFNDGNADRFRRFGGDNGINSTQSLGINFNVGNEEIFRVGGNMMYSHSARNSHTLQNRQYLFTDSVSYNDIGKHTRDRGHNVRGDFRVQWKPDSANTFDFRPRITLSWNHSASSDSTLITAGDALRTQVSRSSNITDSRGHSIELSGEAIYNHNFLSHRGRSFSVQASYRFSNTRERSNDYSINEFYLLGDSLDLYDQYTNNRTWANTVQGRVSWTEPLGNVRNGNFLTISYQLQYRWNNSDKMVYEYPVVYADEVTTDAVSSWIDYTTRTLDEELSSRFRNNYMNQDIRLGFKRIRSRYNMEVGLSLVPQMSKSTELINGARSIPERWVWNYAPFMRYRLKFSKTRSLSLNYRGQSSQPSMSQLQPVADVSDPMNIVVGNPDLDPSFTHNVSVRFQDFNADRQRSIMAMLNVRMTQNSIISRTTFDDVTGGRTTTYENVNGIWNAHGMTMFSMPFTGNKAFQITNMLNFNYSRSVGYNNTERNVSNNLRLGESFGIAFRPDNLELELRPQYTFQRTWNSIKSTSDNAIHNYGGNFNATYYTPINVVLSSDVTYTGTSGYTSGYNKNEWMWNAQIAYQFLPGNAATIALKVYDLLHQKSDISRSVTANYIDDTRYNTLTRYFMLTFTYRFNSFSKRGEATPEDMTRPRHGGPGGGPPPGMGGGRPPI